jgi:ribosomal protein S18 acetylase RimI-like enzyme
VKGLIVVAVGVLPEYRRRGIAKALLQEAFSRNLPVRLFVNAENLGAKKLYEALGFKTKILEMARYPQ